jgi:hypothetical protein
VKKLFILLGVLAATSAIIAGTASAAPFTTTTCTSDLTQGGTNWMEVGNLTVPAGSTCHFWGYVDGALTVNGSLMLDGTVFGNASVGTTGHLKVSNGHFQGNLGVTGGSLKFINQASSVTRNLSISQSTGDIDPNDTNMNGFWAPVTVGGNFSYTGNYVPLYGGPTSAANL